METLETLSGILPVIIEICTPILMILIGYLVRKLAQKLEVEKTIETDKLIDNISNRAIKYIEKLDKNLQKSHQAKLESGDKLTSAIDIVVNELEKLGIVDVTTEVLVQKIEAALLEIDQKK